jgi:hypothetical protein
MGGRCPEPAPFGLSLSKDRLSPNGECGTNARFGRREESGNLPVKALLQNRIAAFTL